MEIREKLEENQKTLAIVVGVLVVVAILVAFLTMRSGRGGGFGGSAEAKLFYTVDDGKTWFEDDATKLPPFDHEGKTAVRVQVYKCGENGQPFAGYLQRIDDAAHKSAEAARAAGKPQQEIEAIWQNSVEVKRPGETRWVSIRDRASEAIMVPKCPDGKTIPVAVFP
jgi:hypothetical protein